MIIHCIITEYCSKGDLDSAISEKKEIGEAFSLKQVAYWSMQIAKGLVFLHQMNIVHRDIKPK
jgi:wee1-like protein kinase